MAVKIWFFIITAEKEILVDYFITKHKKSSQFL